MSIQTEKFTFSALFTSFRNLARCIFFRSRLSIQVQYTPISRSVVLLLWFRFVHRKEDRLQKLSKLRRLAAALAWRYERGLVNYSTPPPRRRYYEQRTSKQKQQTFHDLKMIFFLFLPTKQATVVGRRLLLLPLGTVSLLINYKCIQGG